MAKHVLITGGAGFIGSHLSEALLATGNRVTVLDNFDDFYSPEAKRQNIAPLLSNPNFTLVEGDIRSKADLSKLPTGIDAVVHLAARAGVRPSINLPELYEDVNVKGLLNMLEFARAQGIKQFVFASSSSVYGNNPQVPWREDLNLREVISPYAATKLAGEHFGSVYSHLYGMRFIALRLFAVYGPRQRPDLALNKFSQQLLAGQEVTLYGDGSTSRDYTYVGDIVAGFVAALNYTQSNFEVFNIGNSQTVMLLELLEAIEAAFGKKAIRQFMEEQPGDVTTTYSDISKAGKLLGYKPQTSLQQGIQAFKAWWEGLS